MIKEKLRRGTFLYKLYLYYHLYVRYKFLYKKRNYSQFQEDLFLLDFFKKKSTGKFVDLGAFHPMKFNNTYLGDHCFEYKKNVREVTFFNCQLINKGVLLLFFHTQRNKSGL